MLLLSSLAPLLQTLFESVGIFAWEMMCFHVRSTYSTSEVSIVLDTSIFTSVMVFFLSWHECKGKENDYLEWFEALLGREGWVFHLNIIIIIILLLYSPLRTKVSRALSGRLEVSLPPNEKLLGCTHFWHPREPLFSLPRDVKWAVKLVMAVHWWALTLWGNLVHLLWYPGSALRHITKMNRTSGWWKSKSW